MKALLELIILVFILWGWNCFSDFQMRHIGNLNPAIQAEYAEKINMIGELNTHERSF